MLRELLVVAMLASGSNVTIDAVYPNPATPDDVGEFVVLDVGERTTTPLVLSDGEDRVTIEGPLPSGRVAVAWEPALARSMTDVPVVAVNQSLALSNGGERIVLRDGNRTISSLQYSSAPEAERFSNGEWSPPHRSDFEPVRVSDVPVTAFGLPDRPKAVDSFLESADQRLLLGGYTFTDPTITDRLVEAKQRGVEVRVVLEGDPVGGLTTQEREEIDVLKRAGVEVRFLGGERSRYAYHHAKYAVADDRLLVTSENWKPGGTGGNGSRGWGIVVRDPTLADQLAAVFHSDTGWNDSKLWADINDSTLQADSPDNTTYPRRFDQFRTRANETTLLVAPDNARQPVRRLLRGANRSIWIQQVSIQRDGILLNETMAAARRGVEVRILLSGAWYVESENRKLAESLRKRAEREHLPVRVRIVEPRSRFEHVHNKGVIVDRRSVLVGSLNWNEHALGENREVVVRVDDPAVADYFERIFLADWRGAAWRIQWGLLGALLLATVAAGQFARQIGTFEDAPGDYR